MKLNQLYYFKCVCKHSNITKAAEELHISRPAITRSIHDLEEELGVTLLTRTNKNVSLTNEGKLFLYRSSEILSNLDSLTDEMRDLGYLRRSSVRIGVPPAIGTLVLPRLSIIAAERFQLELEISELSSYDALSAVENDDLDLAICLLDDQEYPMLEYYMLKDTSLCFCTNVNHPLAKEKLIRIEQLADEKIIFFYPGELMQQTFERHSVTPKYILKSNQMLTICNYLAANLASTLQFPEAFANYPQITSVPLADDIPLPICLIKKKGKRLAKGASQLYHYIGTHPEDLFAPTLKTDHSLSL